MSKSKTINLDKVIKASREQRSKAERAHNHKMWMERNMEQSPEWMEREQKELDELRAEAKEALDSYRALRDDTLSEVIAAGQGKARERTISPSAIVDALIEVEDDLGISKKAMEGIIILVDANAQKFPRAYKFTPMSTQFCATYKRGHWYLCYVRRDSCNPPSHRITIHHTEASKEALIEKHSHW